MRDRFSSVDEVVGGSKFQKDIAKSYAAHKFETQELGKGEREKTPEEFAIIQMADDSTNLLRVKYGLDAFSVPAKNIHIIKSESWRQGAKDSAGKSSTGSQSICIKETEILSQFAHLTIHEMLHFKSFDVWRLLQEETKSSLAVLSIKSKNDPSKNFRTTVTGHRSGLRAGNSLKEKSFFNALNEAVVEELTRRILISWRKNPLLSTEWKQTNDLLDPEEDDKDEIIYLEKKDNKKRGNVFVYKDERKVLDQLIEKVVEKNPGRFKDKEEVFDSFVRLFFTGKAGTFLQIFDQTFGPGTLRKIAECDDDIDALEKFVSEL